MPEYLITNGTIVTQNRNRELITGGAVAVDGGEIVSIGPASKLEDAFETTETIDAEGGVVLPRNRQDT